MKRSYDVVIAGGGVTGSSAAYWLTSQGDFDGSVLVIERDPTYEGAPSARAGGGIRQQFSTPENIRIGLYGAEFIKTVDERLGVDGDGTGIVFREQGYLLLATPQTRPVIERNMETQTALGADVRFVEPGPLGEQCPWLELGGIAGASFGASNEGWVDPYGLLQAYKRKARSLGADYLNDTVTKVIFEGSRVAGVELGGGGRVSAGTVINAAGASGGRALAASAGIHLPIESRQRCFFVYECRRGDMAGAPLTVLPEGVIFRPESGRFLGTVAPPPERDPDTQAFDVDYWLFDEIIWPSLAKWVPDFESIKLANAYSCHYDFNTLDENLIIGAAPGVDGFLFALGFSGHGLQQSPAVGRALYELVTFGEYRALDLHRFGFERTLTGEGLHEKNCW